MRDIAKFNAQSSAESRAGGVLQIAVRFGAAFRKMTRRIDRAIRKIEDRHRGELPYMRQMHAGMAAPEIDLAGRLRNMGDAALRTAASTLRHTARADAGELRHVADLLAQITRSLDALCRDVAAPKFDQAAAGRREPVLTSALEVQISDLAARVKQEPAPRKSGTNS